jgi:hypothetical protein
MTKQKLTILLIGIMCLSPVSGLCAVLCHCSDGYVTVTPLLGNLCECPQSDVSGIAARLSDESLIESSTDHDCCIDSVAPSNNIIFAQKNTTFPTSNVIAAYVLVKPVSSQTSHLTGSLSAGCTKLPSFFLPLKTVILLA